MSISIATLIAPVAADLADLVAVLNDVVAGGASVGFMLPIDEPLHADFWRGLLADVAAGTRVLLVARDAGRIVGTVSLDLAQRPNGRHRCELQKLLVRRSHRRRGIAAALLSAAADAARAHQRTLIVLDSGATGNALGLYDRAGYIRVGVIPRYALDPDGPFCDTVIFYKELSPVRVAENPRPVTAARRP
jgi:ribosomal protein S18 acetylase RimI-like enzyme